MPEVERSADEPWLCPVCDLIHRHEVALEVREGTRPEVRCPCPACRTVNRQWDTVDEYLNWLERTMPAIEEEARELPRGPEPETPEDREHRHEVEELMDERAHEIARQKRDGEWDVAAHSAWGKDGPPTD